MRRVYAKLPSVCVKPLHFSAEDISAARLLAMMKIDEGTRVYHHFTPSSTAQLTCLRRDASVHGGSHVHLALDGVELQLQRFPRRAQVAEIQLRAEGNAEPSALATGLLPRGRQC